MEVSEEDISMRFIEVERRINEELSSRPPIHPIITIDDEIGAIVTVKDEDGYLIVSSGDDIILQTSNDKYRLILFSNCDRVDFRIETKLCRVSFHNCERSRIVCTASSIGPLEIYDSREIQVLSRVQLPVITIEKCNEISVMQMCDESIYSLKTSIGVTINIVGTTSTFSLGKLFWDEGEVQFVLISSLSGCNITRRYYLPGDNNLSIVL